MAKLTPKQQRFVDEYLIDLNATQSAIRAGYSPKTAEQGAAQLLRNIKVQEKITKSDLFRILYVLQEDLSGLYVKNYRDLVGIDKDQEAEIIAKGEAEVESYTKSRAVLENALQNMKLREERGG